jgi:class 3 adenylate cyclase
VDVPETRYADVGGSQVAYQVVGDGPIDLVFTHGFCHIDLRWDPVSEASFLRALASFSRLILFDRRGSGASDPVADGHFPTWEEWNLDLLAVLDAASSHTAALFAETEAGPMAMMFAAAHPERVRALILNNTAARYAVAPEYPIGISPDDIDGVLQYIESTWGTVDMFSGDAIAERSALARVCRAAATPRMAATQFRHIYSELDARDAMPLIAAPTLIIVNQHTLNLDRSTGLPERARFVAENINDARLLELPGENILAFAEQDGRVVDAVAEFVTGDLPTRPTDRVLATILFTDIVASTEQAAAIGDQRWRTLLDAHDRELRRILRHHRGQEINTTGDGFLISFDGPARAVDCAIAMTRAAQNLQIAITVGMHTGECERRGDDIAGLAVHVASLAEPNEVLVSRTVTDLVLGSGITFEDKGQHDLKGIPGTWQLYKAASDR